MEIKLYGRLERISIDGVKWLVFERRGFDRVYANLFHLHYSLLLLMLNELFIGITDQNCDLPLLSKSRRHKPCQRILSFNVL